MQSLIWVLQWPGYGYISWIASIPIDPCEKSGYQCGPITRSLLAAAVAQHFRAFMTVSLSYTRCKPTTSSDITLLRIIRTSVFLTPIRTGRL
jgi:hypothetical protein